MSGGRPQRGVDPGAGPLAAFAADLRALRSTSGNPTYRTMAASSGVPAGSLARTARGLALPRVDLVRAYVLACGGDELTWIARWREMADAEHVHRRAARAPAAGDGRRVSASPGVQTVDAGQHRPGHPGPFV